MEPGNLETVAAKLRRKIPAPRVEPAKPQASWHLLKAGQRLQSTTTVKTLTGAVVGDGTLFEVMSCSNRGALMKPLGDLMGPLGLVLWNDKEWKRSFTRVRKEK